MKRTIPVLIVMLFALIMNTQAQQGQGRRSPEERAKMMAQRLTDSLKLTADQQKSVETVYLESGQSMAKLREGLTPGTQPEKADIDKINTARDTKLKSILTDAQYKKLKEDIEPSMRRPRGDRPPGN